MRPQHPGKMLRAHLDEAGLTQDDLAAITGIRRQTFSSIISGKSGITAEMAVALAAVFRNSASEWLSWDSQYRLSILESDTAELQEKARLYASAPIREMQRRGWIKDTDQLEELKAELFKFSDEDAGVDEAGDVRAAFRRSASDSQSLTPSERYWYLRARQIAKALSVGRFIPSRLRELEARLRELAAYTKEARHLTRVFAEYGIRFLVVEPLPGTKIDGAAFWLNADSPVIAVSLRADRIDGFWFTVFHEFKHIDHRDALSVDSGLIADDKDTAPLLVVEESERLANEGAAHALIPKSELDSFVRRVGPLYSKQRIIQFAHRIKMHPGIIVGQLQHRNELGYSAHRDLLAKIRAVVTETSVTDGWGEHVPSTML